MIYNLKNCKLKWVIAVVIIAVLVLNFEYIYSDEQKVNLSLSKSYSIETLRGILIDYQNWHPFPKPEEHEMWMSIPEATRKCYIVRGERLLGYKWSFLPATVFLEFVRNGNRSNYEALSFDRRNKLSDLVIAECLEGKGRFINDIVNGIWAICEESYWGVPAHLYMQKIGPGLPDVEEPTVDLFVSETVNLLAWTHYLLGQQLDAVSPLIQRRIQKEAERRVLIPCLERDDFQWMGFAGKRVNNWDPWCNSNWLTADLLLETNKEKRISAVNKILKSLDFFIGGYAPDGGCDEGPGYWNVAGGALFDCLELLYSATNGKINFYNEPLIKEIGRYIYRVHIYDDYFVNFADASAKADISSDVVFRYGKKIGDERLAKFGAYFAEKRRKSNQCVSGNMGHRMFALFNLSELLTAKPAQPLIRDVWMENVQVMTARSLEGSEKGLYLAAKGGHNAESHNHNDVGNFIVCVDGYPVIIDVGVETYTAKTFNENRYEIWTMQSAYHNLPIINGVMEKEGREFEARNVVYKFDDSFAQLSLDIAGTYPKEANVDSWVRTIRLNRGKDIKVTESYKLAKSTQDLKLCLMTPCKATIDKPGVIALDYIKNENNPMPIKVLIHYEMNKFKPSFDEISIEDNRLKSVWGDRLIRIIFQVNSPKLQDTLTFRITQS